MALIRGFDGLYGQDAYAYFDYSIGPVRESLTHFMALAPFFWPPGYPLLVAVSSLVFGPVALSGQVISLLMGALVPVFTAFLVRELWPEDLVLALLAGAIVALCGQLWQSSVVVMADTTGLACAAFAAWALARYARFGGAAWLLAASAALAYATLSRWIYGLVALPLAVYALVQLSKTHRWSHAVGATVVASAILVPLLGPSIIGLFNHPNDQAAFAGNFQVYSWSPVNAFRREFQTSDGHLQYPLPNGLYYALAPANFAFIGPLFAASSLVGLYFAVRRWSWTTGVLIVGWAAVVFIFHAGAPWQNFRFTLAYLPPIAILSATGALTLGRAIRVPGHVAIAVLALALIASAVSAVRLEKTFIDRKDDALALVHWVDTQLPPDAQLLTFGPTLAFRHYSRVPTYDLYEIQRPEDLDAVLSSAARPYLLLDEASVETQWLAQAPSNNFHTIRETHPLHRIGADQGYTLFSVEAT